MSWEKVKLGDITDACLGKMLDQQKNRGEFQPYLANVNVRWGAFDLEDLPQMRFEENEQERYGLRYGDLVVCEGGEPGRCAIWKEQVPNMKIQKALHRVRVHDGLDYRYLYYWFSWAGRRGALDQYFTGATIKHMPGQKLKEVVIDKPSIEIQRRIADTLSAYDNLIENNQKQIKLLEEAAQRLYKEWFVDLRFPGYEATLVVDGVPKGWAYKPFSDVFSYVRGKSYTSKELSDTTGVLMINLKNIRSFGGYNRNAEKRFTGRYNANQILSAGDVIMGVTDMTQERRLVGHAALVPDMGETMTFSMDLIKLVVEAHLEALFEPPSLPRGVRGINIKLVQDTAIKRYSQLLKDENQPYQLYDNHLIPLVSDTELKEIEMAVSTCHSSVNKRVSRFWKRYQIIYS